MGKKTRVNRERARLAAIVTPMADGAGHMVYASTGHREELFVRTAPDSVPGQHRWAVLAMWAVDPTTMEPEEPQTRFLDHENLLSLSSPLCFDCEQLYTPDLATQPCPGDPS